MRGICMTKKPKAKEPETVNTDNDLFEGFVENSVMSDLTIDQVSDSLGLKTISIRMQPDLLEELKMIASLRGLGYQPLIKQQLRRFVDAELKQLLREKFSENLKAETSGSDNNDKTPPEAKCA